MAEPPRLHEITLHCEQRVIYFVTLCVEHRHSVLAIDDVFAAIRASIPQLRNWNVLALVVMPDHVHCVLSPRHRRELSIGDFANAFKRLLRKELVQQNWQWQRGCFDRLLRSDENLWSKWIYIRDNPVRAGLVSSAEEWPYYVDLVNAPQSVGDAVSVPHHRKNGKLTASPTGGSS